MSSNRIAVRLNQCLLAALDSLCARHKVTRSEMLRALIRHAATCDLADLRVRRRVADAAREAGVSYHAMWRRLNRPTAMAAIRTEHEKRAKEGHEL